jgi:hypothetical protein
LVQERPPISDVVRDVQAFCREQELKPPSRATVYNYMASMRPDSYRVADLPPAVRSALYNLDQTGIVPGHQLTFYAFNYGSLDAVMFAAGLPWLDLYQAARLPGWRRKSRGLLDAVMLVRGI